MTKVFVRALLAAVLGLSGLFGLAGAASAQVTDPCQSNANVAAGDGSSVDNPQNCSNEGDSDAAADQSGSASSGDGVAGQVAGVVSAGDASVDATNRSDDVDVQTGDATGTNFATARAEARTVSGGTEDACESDGNTSVGAGSTVTNDQNCGNSGDADAAADQSAEAASGDGVGGQVIGVVTSAGGSADLVLDNESTDSDVDTGNGEFTNDATNDSSAVTFVA